MLKQSFGSVEVFWLDRNAVLQSVKRAVRRLARARPEVRKVILFGSLARGDAVPGSDADLLIVLAESDLTFLARIPRYALSGVPVGVDVFPYTEEEVADISASGKGFVSRALSEGIPIFVRRSKTSSHTSGYHQGAPSG